MELSDGERSDFHTKFLAMHIRGDPEKTTADFPMPWDEDPDEF